MLPLVRPSGSAPPTEAPPAAVVVFEVRLGEHDVLHIARAERLIVGHGLAQLGEERVLVGVLRPLGPTLGREAQVHRAHRRGRGTGIGRVLDAGSLVVHLLERQRRRRRSGLGLSGSGVRRRLRDLVRGGGDLVDRGGGLDGSRSLDGSDLWLGLRLRLGLVEVGRTGIVGMVRGKD